MRLAAHKPGTDMRISLLTTIFLLIANIIAADETGAPPRPVEFFAEEIALSVTDSTAEVTGIYHFRNNTAREGIYPVAFPFYVDSLCPYPDRIDGFEVESGAVGRALEIRKYEQRNSITISIPLKPHAVTTWRLEYRQRIRGNSARYILTSTQSWGEPLEEATYEFVVPSEFTDVHVWPEADSVIEEGHYCKYRAHRIDFMPTKDMEIVWAPKNQIRSHRPGLR
jgi:hypothetical protein